MIKNILNKSKSILNFFMILSVSCTFLLTNSCQYPEGMGAAVGAGIGALGGAVYSENKDKKVKAGTVVAGAALGALAGGVAVAVAKHKAQPYRSRDLAYGGDSRYNNSSYHRRAPAQIPAPTPRYKVGIKTGTRNVVRSPHKPYSNIDVAGFRRGEVVQDENGNPFIVP